MFHAAAQGHLRIVQLMLDQGIEDYNRAMTFAALNGHLDIVELLLSRGANNINKVMEVATRRDQVYIIRLMLERGATNYDEAMTYTALNGNLNRVELNREFTVILIHKSLESLNIV